MGRTLHPEPPMGSAERRRGADAERAVVRYLRDNGYPDARRYLAGDGRQPGDIDFHPLVCLEVKDVERSAWPTWCRQALAEARPGMVPVVVRRTRGVADVGAWEVRYWRRGWDDATDRAPITDADLPRRIVQMRAGYCGSVSFHATTLSAFTAALARFDAIDAGRTLGGAS